MSADDKQVAQRRGFLKTLGLAAGGAAVASAAEASGPLRADAVPAGTARKEGQADRLKSRYQPNSPHVQAFYRTNGSSDK